MENDVKEIEKIVILTHFKDGTILMCDIDNDELDQPFHVYFKLPFRIIRSGMRDMFRLLLNNGPLYDHHPEDFS